MEHFGVSTHTASPTTSSTHTNNFFLCRIVDGEKEVKKGWNVKVSLSSDNGLICEMCVRVKRKRASTAECGGGDAIIVISAALSNKLAYYPQSYFFLTPADHRTKTTIITNLLIFIHDDGMIISMTCVVCVISLFTADCC